MKRFYWSGFSNTDRHSLIADISLIIGKYGLLANFLRSSDMSLGLCIEIEENRVMKLYNELNDKVVLSGNTPDVDIRSVDECVVMIHLTFTQGTGDLEIENPGIIE